MFRYLEDCFCVFFLASTLWGAVDAETNTLGELGESFYCLLDTYEGGPDAENTAGASGVGQNPPPPPDFGSKTTVFVCFFWLRHCGELLTRKQIHWESLESLSIVCSILTKEV
jgi:hypothetical protein